MRWVAENLGATGPDDIKWFEKEKTAILMKRVDAQQLYVLLLAYLLAAKDLPLGDSRVFEIGGADVVSYGDMIREYAKQRHLRRFLIAIPVLTPYLSSLWLGLVTPSRAAVARHLIEGLRNPTIVRDPSALHVFFNPPHGHSRGVCTSTC